MYYKQATAEDIPFIMDAERHPDNESFVLQWSYEKHLDSLNDSDFLYLIFKDKITNEHIGFCILTQMHNTDGVIKLKRFVITSKGKGYGKEAMRLIQKNIFDIFYATKLELEVFADNDHAIQFYLTAGFTKNENSNKQIIKNDTHISVYTFSLTAPKIK